MKNKILICAALGFMTLQPLFSQDSATKKIIEIGQNDNQAMHHLDILSNRFGGRLIGSDAYENAAEWMLHEFKKWGIEAHLEEAGTVPVGFNRGPWFGRMISDNGMTLHFATPSYTAGTHGVQRGHVVIEPKTEDELKKMKGQLKGAWVLVGGTNEGWPYDRSAKADSIRKAAKKENIEIAKENSRRRALYWETRKPQQMLPYKEVPYLFYQEMVDAGVLGFIQSSPLPIRVLYDRPLVNDPKTDFDNLPTVPDIKLDENQYMIIKKMAIERQTFELEFDIRNHFKLGPIKYYNVVAQIKGSKYPDEKVMISGHLDAYDVGTGAVDCGTGIAPMMEAARMIALSGAKPKRTIQFVAFAGEEFGLLGALAYCKKHAKELDKIANLFNRDGGTEPPVGISVPKAMYDDIVKISKPIASINPEFPFVVKEAGPRNKPTKLGGTDASVFSMKGVPTIGFTCEDVLGTNFSYEEIWHTERDLYNKQIPQYQAHTATVTAVMALGIANLDKQLSREGLYKTPEK